MRRKGRRWHDTSGRDRVHAVLGALYWLVALRLTTGNFISTRCTCIQVEGLFSLFLGIKKRSLLVEEPLLFTATHVCAHVVVFEGRGGKSHAVRSVPLGTGNAGGHYVREVRGDICLCLASSVWVSPCILSVVSECVLDHMRRCLALHQYATQ